MAAGVVVGMVGMARAVMGSSRPGMDSPASLRRAARPPSPSRISRRAVPRVRMARMKVMAVTDGAVIVVGMGAGGVMAAATVAPLP